MGTGQRYYAASRVVKKSTASTPAHSSLATRTRHQICSPDSQGDQRGRCSPDEPLRSPRMRQDRQEDTDRDSGQQHPADKPDAQRHCSSHVPSYQLKPVQLMNPNQYDSTCTIQRYPHRFVKIGFPNTES